MTDITETTETEATEAEAGKGEGKGGAARHLARALWLVEWQAANPEAKPADRKAAWKALSEADRSARMETARKALRHMRRQGVVISVEKAAEEAGDEA